MLAVVHLEAVALERVDGAAEAPPHLHERHRHSGLRAVERGGDAGQAAADDDHLPAPAMGGPAMGCASHAGTPSMPRTATSAFSRAGSETRPRSTASGSASMRSSSRR